MSYDNVVEEAYIHQLEGISKSLGDGAVRATGLHPPRRVIMGENNRCRIPVQGTDNHFSRVNGGTIEGALKQIHTPHYPMPTIEKQTAENLPSPTTDMTL